MPGEGGLKGIEIVTRITKSSWITLAILRLKSNDPRISPTNA